MLVVAGKSPQDGHDRLDVWIWIWSRTFGNIRLPSGRFHGMLLICRILRTFLVCFLLPGRCPGSVLPDIGSQDLRDGPVVFFGLPGDPFEAVDAAYTVVPVKFCKLASR